MISVKLDMIVIRLELDIYGISIISKPGAKQKNGTFLPTYFTPLILFKNYFPFF